MSEHVHEWTVQTGGGGAVCYGCPGFPGINMAEIERRLNATERLSAETAIGASITVSMEYQAKALLDYAAALDGE